MQDAGRHERLEHLPEEPLWESLHLGDDARGDGGVLLPAHEMDESRQSVGAAKAARLRARDLEASRSRSSGQEVWHFEGVHVDGKPAVANNRVCAGSGYGKLEVFCLDAGNGKPVWRLPVEFSAFAAPTVHGECVFFGIGNGNLLGSAELPAGALLCVDAQGGRELWRYPYSGRLIGRGGYRSNEGDHTCFLP
jgi:PQQ-like domain